MALNTSAMTPAVLKAKEVATVDYVDSAVSSMPNTDEEWQARVQYALDADETVINGSKITTGSIDAGRVNTGTLNANVVNGLKIVGNSIEGAQITGSVIRSSWIDYSTSGDLTDWTYFTPATVPPAYTANFAVNNTTGALVTDSNGFVRLPGIKKLYSIPTSINKTQPTDTVGIVTTRAFDLSDDIHSYDDYTHTTGRRVVKARNKIKVDSNSTLFSIGVRNPEGSTTYGTLTCRIGNSSLSVSITATCTGHNTTYNQGWATTTWYYSYSYSAIVNGVTVPAGPYGGLAVDVEGFHIVGSGANVVISAEAGPRLMDTDYTGNKTSIFGDFTVSCGPGLWHDAYTVYEQYVPAGYDYPACTVGIPQFYIDRDV